MRLRVLFAAIVLASGMTRAAVVGPTLFSARQMAMGGAGVGAVDDRYSLYVNPAGLNTLRDKWHFSLPTLSLNYNPQTLWVSLFTTWRYLQFFNPGGIDRAFANRLREVKGEYIQNAVVPSTDLVTRNFGIGLYGYSELDAIYDEGIYEPMLTFQSRTDVVALTAISRRIVRPLTVGLSFKYMYRLEAPVTKVWVRELEKIQFNEVFTNESDTLDFVEEIKNGIGSDLGLMWHLGYFKIGNVWRNWIGWVGDQPMLKQLDVGVSYTIPGLINHGIIERALLTADVSDLGSDRMLWNRLHLGTELMIPLGGVRAGINQGYFTWGFDIQMLFGQLEFVDYSKELGEYPGHIRSHSYVLVMRIGF